MCNTEIGCIARRKTNEKQRRNDSGRSDYKG